MAQASLKAGLAALLMLSTAPAAFAQPYDAPQYPAPDYSQQSQDLQTQQERYQEQQDENQQQQQQYRDARQRYEDQRQRYQDQQQAYQVRRDAYAGARAQYDADREAYDARYGAGAWERDFGGDADARYAPGYYAPNAYAYSAPSAYYGQSCENRRTGGALVGGVIGAIAGGAIGSSVAEGAARGGGTAIGAVLGGLVGAGIGRSAAQCDDSGYYFSYDETYPYREGAWESGRSGRYDYDWYASHECRLAVAPATYNGDTEDRYVRVCPDAEGRYRITG